MQLKNLFASFFTKQNQRTPFRMPTPSHGGGSGKTRKGAKHKPGTIFRSRQILPMTPAQYRRYHFGSSKTKKSS